MRALDSNEGRHFRLADDRLGLREARTGLPGWAIALVTALVVALAAVGAVLVLQLRVQPSAPTCPSAGRWLETIVAQEQAGQWAVAATNAATALRTPNLCADGARAEIARKAIDDGREALFIGPPAPGDANGQQRVVDAYNALSREAAILGLQDLVAPMRIAGPAYNAGEFLLAAVALDEAFTGGAVGPTDANAVGLYYAALRNAGVWYARGPSSGVRDQGAQFLVTACHMSETLRLNGREACDDAAVLLGPDRGAWPRDLPTYFTPPVMT